MKHLHIPIQETSRRMESIKMEDLKVDTRMTATKPQTQDITIETLGETQDIMTGIIREIFQEAGEVIVTLADITEIITTTHKDDNRSNNIKDTEGPSTDNLEMTGGSTGTMYRTSTDTVQITVNSTDTEMKHRWTEHRIQVGITGTVMCRIIIKGIRT